MHQSAYSFTRSTFSFCLRVRAACRDCRLRSSSGVPAAGDLAPTRSAGHGTAVSRFLRHWRGGVHPGGKIRIRVRRIHRQRVPGTGCGDWIPGASRSRAGRIFLDSLTLRTVPRVIPPWLFGLGAAFDHFETAAPDETCRSNQGGPQWRTEARWRPAIAGHPRFRGDLRRILFHGLSALPPTADGRLSESAAARTSPSHPVRRSGALW